MSCHTASSFPSSKTQQPLTSSIGKVKRSTQFTYTVDIVSDGSEHTGPSTVFLSVYRLSQYHQQDAWDDDDSLLQARYAIAGLGDLLSRAAADQRYKLHPVRAVFAGSMIDLQGLPGLLTVLHQAGRSDLTVVSSAANGSRVEDVIHTVHKYKKHPTVRICQVPVASEQISAKETRANVSESSNGDEPKARATPTDPRVVWWNVYEDDYIQVHASSTFMATHEAASIVYLYTLKMLPCPRNNLLLVPPSIASSTELSNCWISHMPVSDENENPLEVLAGILLNDRDSTSELCHSVFQEHCQAIRWFVVSSQPQTADGMDPGLLVRAQQQSRAWNEIMPLHFPWKGCSSNDTFLNHQWSQQDAKSTDLERLVSGTSLAIMQQLDNYDVKFSLLNRLRDKGICMSKMASSERLKWPEELRDFLANSYTFHHASVVDDKNEIDLEGTDSSDLDNDDDPVEWSTGIITNGNSDNMAHLLVLGSGCASPSPYRGASGYALVLPGDDTALAFEVGEGFVTQWHRYGNERPLNMIRLIWISHAHWDHYGGLVNLLVCLHKERTRSRAGNDRCPKRGRLQEDEPPHVVAPRKVLQYLYKTFPEAELYFRAFDHRTSSEISLVRNSIVRPSDGFQPVVFFQNVPVHHSCREAYGFVMGWKNTVGELGTMCFSGDTRPCRELVDACRDVSLRFGKSQVDLLLHEATFDETENAMSLAKKHSTVSEAIRMAREVGASRTLLTHFSQRYDSVPKIDPKMKSRVGFALDGLLVSL